MYTRGGGVDGLKWLSSFETSTNTNYDEAYKLGFILNLILEDCMLSNVKVYHVYTVLLF